jgi:NADH-quinone oxidoreductase subunit M
MNPDSLGQMHLLSIVTWLPLAGAILLLLIPKARVEAIKRFANAWMLLAFLVSLPLLTYDPGVGGMQFVEDAEWIPLIGARYSLGVDGISVSLVLLTTLLGVIATASSWNYIAKREKEFYVFMLLMQTTMIGVFCSLDLFLFYVFWEITLVPMYFLIGIWGGDARLYAAIKFFLYTLAGSVVMLLAILKLYFLTTDAATLANLASVQAAAKTIAGSSAAAQGLVDGALSSIRSGEGTFSILALQAIGGAKLVTGASLVPLVVQIWIFAGLFTGFAFKVPMFPFHTWLPDAHVEAPTAGSVILAGVLLKLGGYGFVRFSLPMLPDACRDPGVLAVVITLAIVGILYGALCSMYFVVTAGDMKKLVAYSSVSHMGMVILGLFALNPNGINGAVMQMINHGISTSALFLIVGILYERRHTRLVSEYGGLSAVVPGFAAVFMIMVLSSIGLPLLNGFIGEFLVLRGAFEANPWWAAGGVLGIILGAAYTLWLYQRLMFGPVERDENRALPDLSRREWAYMLPLVALAFWIGVYPKPVLELLERPVQLISYQIWHQPGVEDRYAPTVEEQERLARLRASQAASAGGERP